MNYRTLNKLLLLSLVALTIGLSGSANADRRSADAEAEEVAQALSNLSCSAPKPRVAVFSFHATGKLAVFEGYNVGDGLAAQLATELTRTECFVVLDRTGLSNVLLEQELGLAGVVNRETAPASGRLVGAEVIIKGAITEFEPNKRGRGLTLGVGLPNTPLGVRLGRNGSTAHVGLDVSIIDATTGQVRNAHRVTADSKAGGWTLGLDFENASLGGDTFAKSPLGIASRNALGQAILKIASDLGGIPWRAQVVDTSDGVVFVNAGVESGIKAGDLFHVSTVVRTLVDPATGLLIDTIERDVGRVRIISVNERYAMAEPIDEFRAKRGDFLHL